MISKKGFRGLTPREKLVADMIWRCMTNRQIAGELQLSEKTVQFHIANLYRKLGIDKTPAPRLRIIHMLMHCQTCGVVVKKGHKHG